MSSASHGGKSGEKDKTKETQEEIILGIADKLDIYRTNMDEVYVKLNINNRISHLNVGSDKFKRWITLEYYSKTKRMPSTENIGKAVNLIKAKSMLQDQVTIGKRCSVIDENIYYDLMNNKGEVVKVSKDGWTITTNSECIFDSNTSMKEQVRPIEYESLDILDKYFR